MTHARISGPSGLAGAHPVLQELRSQFNGLEVEYSRLSSDPEVRRWSMASWNFILGGLTVAGSFGVVTGMTIAGTAQAATGVLAPSSALTFASGTALAGAVLAKGVGQLSLAVGLATGDIQPDSSSANQLSSFSVSSTVVEAMGGAKDIQEFAHDVEDFSSLGLRSVANIASGKSFVLRAIGPATELYENGSEAYSSVSRENGGFKGEAGSEKASSSADGDRAGLDTSGETARDGHAAREIWEKFERINGESQYRCDM